MSYSGNSVFVATFINHRKVWIETGMSVFVQQIKVVGGQASTRLHHPIDNLPLSGVG